MTAPLDVHLRFLTPDFAASAYRLLKARDMRPDLLVGSLVVVPTNGTTDAVQHVVAGALATRLVPPTGITVTSETPSYLCALRSTS